MLLEVRERLSLVAEDEIDVRGVRIDVREAGIDARGVRIDPREARIDPREARIDLREARIDPREDKIDAREDRIDPREARIVPRGVRIDPWEARIDSREARIDVWESFRGAPERFPKARAAAIFSGGSVALSRGRVLSGRARYSSESRMRSVTTPSFFAATGSGCFL
jgi:uncharacterized protein (DUF3084 family)